MEVPRYLCALIREGTVGSMLHRGREGHLEHQHREKTMSHEVRLKIHAAVVAHRDFEVVIRTNGGKIGTLLISKGNVEWLPKGNYINKRRLSWGRFGEFMERHGKLAKKK